MRPTRGRLQRSCEGTRIAVAHHAGYHDRAYRRRVGYRRTRDVSEDDAGADVGDAEATSDAAEDAGSESGKTGRHAARRHQCAGKHEQRNASRMTLLVPSEALRHAVEGIRADCRMTTEVTASANATGMPHKSAAISTATRTT